MKRIALNSEWKFAKRPGLSIDDLSGVETCDFTSIDLPHTWYTPEDPYAGTAVYKKTIDIAADAETAYLEFEGVEQRCVVFINGRKAGEHQGSYSTFRIAVPEEELVKSRTGLEIIVTVNNERSEELAPMFGDFTIFGGIYRNVNLIYASKKSFDYLYYGTGGVIVRTKVDGEVGKIFVEPHVSQYINGDCHIRYDVFSQDNRVVLENRVGNTDKETTLVLDKPKLWDGKGKAALYKLRAAIICGDSVCDETELAVGFRDIRITSDEGLFLNGRNYRLNGVAKHQDYGTSYNAVDKSQIEKDFELIHEIGANAVRLSHYQHPQQAYDICDEAGLLVWAEIPMLKMTTNDKLFETTCMQLRELILQNIHHPSIYCWGIQNEIAMFRDDPFMHERCKKLTGIAHELDPERYSAGANLYSVKVKSPMNEVSDIVGYNLYFGWYYGQMEDYRVHLDKLHEAKPQVPYGISEYGVDTNINLHSENPIVKDYSEEYQALFHETVYSIFEEKNYLWGSFVWNMFDFSSGIRNEGGVKGMNLKGLVTSDRNVRKDAFYYYKSKWSDETVLHLCSKRFVKRNSESIQIKAYSNLPEAELFVNEKSFGKAQNNGNMTLLWDEVALSEGENSVKIVSGEYEDSCTFIKVSEETDEYRLPGDAGGAVRNWFLEEDTFVKEGYLSVLSRADEVIGDPKGAELVKELFPDLYKVMTEQDVIPLGLEFLSILKRQLGDTADREEKIRAINERLNRIKEKY